MSYDSNQPNKPSTMYLDYTSSKGVEFKIEISQHDEDCLDIRLGGAETRIPIVGAKYRIDALSIMQNVEYNAGHYGERKQHRLQSELIQCVKRISTHQAGDYHKTHFILKNHIAAIIEAMTSDILLHDTALGETQADVLEDLGLTGKL